MRKTPFLEEIIASAVKDDIVCGDLKAEWL